jgi:dipeptidase
MVSHSNDCPQCDFRLAYVPAHDFPEGAMMDIFIDQNLYPRFVNDNFKDTAFFSEVYRRDNLENTTALGFEYIDDKPMGSIPQVQHTFAYVDGAYGIMNEHQLAIGESTCDAALGLRSMPIKFGGNALFGVAHLSRIALQRCKTARCAVQTMGDLAVAHGFYGGNKPDWVIRPDTGKNGMDPTEGGEALTIADPKEVWIFNISPDDTGKSAVWVAQRVPDDEISVVTNTYNIGEIDLTNPDFYLASTNIFAVAIKEKLWDPKSGAPFDFSRAYRSAGHIHASGLIFRDRRKWEVFNQVAPSRHFDAYGLHSYDDSDYYFPFSLKPDHLFDTRQVFRLHRDIFQGTEFDMMKSWANGPFGDLAQPSTPQGMHGEEWMGSPERSISQLWTSYLVISESRDFLPDDIGGRFFYGPHAPITTLFVPVYPSAAKLSNHLPHMFETGTLPVYNKESFWWPVALVSNYASRFFTYTLPMIEKAQERVEVELLKMCDAGEAAASSQSPADALKTMEALQASVSSYALTSWFAFFEEMVGSFHDGWLFKTTVDGAQIVGSVVYPKEWLEFVGTEKMGFAETHLGKKSKEEDRQVAKENASAPTMPVNQASEIGLNTVLLVLGAVMTGWYGKSWADRNWGERSQYAIIPGVNEV